MRGGTWRGSSAGSGPARAIRCVRGQGPWRPYRLRGTGGAAVAAWGGASPGRCCMKDLLRVGRFGPPFASPQEPHCRDAVEGPSRQAPVQGWARRACASRIPNSLAASRLEATLPRGVPTPIRCRRRSPRLQPATCTSSRFRMFGCPRRWTHPSHPARLAHSGRTRRWVAGRWSRQTSSWRQRSCSRRVMLAASAPPWGDCSDDGWARSLAG